MSADLIEKLTALAADLDEQAKATDPGEMDSIDKSSPGEMAEWGYDSGAAEALEHAAEAIRGALR
jgi:hypothetical protein